MAQFRDYYAHWAIISFSFSCAVVQGANPSDALDRPWLVTSFLNGSSLANRNIFDIAFEQDASTSRLKIIWIASSDGLHRYDGYRWHRYGQADGLPSNFVRSVLVTQNGQLWVGTSKGAGIFDGHSFHRNGSDSGLAGQNIRRIIQDQTGAIWFCSDSWPNATGDGGLARFHNGQWQSWHQRDGLPSNYVVNFFRNSQGRQFAVTSAGLAELQGRTWKFPLAKLARPGENWGSATIAESPRFGTVVSTGTDLFVLNGGTWSIFPDTLRHEHGIVSTSDGSILACGNQGPNVKVFVEWTGDHWKRVSASFPTTHDYIENLKEAPDGSIYAVGFDCFRRWERRNAEWRFFPEAPKPLLSGPDGSVWYMDERSFYRQKETSWQNFGQPYKALLPSTRGVWAWDAHRIAFWPAALSQISPSPDPIQFHTAIDTYRTVSLDRQGRLWAFGRDNSGRQHLLRLEHDNRWSEISIPDCLWLEPAPDPADGMWFLVGTKSGEHKLLEVHDGYQASAIPSTLISQYVNSIYVDSRRDVWLLGDTGLHRRRRDNPSRWETITGLPGSGVVKCLEQAGVLWFAIDGTLGGRSGLASFSREAWRTFDTEPISSWSMTGDGQILFGSKSKFYVIPPDGDRLPVTVALPEQEQVISILKDWSGTYWVGTPQGALSFSPARTPPRTAFFSYDTRVLENDVYRVRARAFQFFRPGAPPANFAFSWRMDESPWTAFDSRAERAFDTRGLGLGTHRLEVRARDNDMNVDPAPAGISFRIHQLPLQERRWFLPALLTLALLLAALTIATTTARFKLARQAQQLEHMVEARTAELQLREQELRESNRALRRTNEDLRQFSWAASHDLQEPLRMVVTYTQFLAKRYRGRLDETGEEFIGYAVDGARRVQALLQALLEYWQVSEGNHEKKTPTDTASTLTTALANLDMMVRESNAVVSSSGLPTLDVSEIAFVQLFQNLVSNAIKYRKPNETPHIEIVATPSDESEWLFSIADNGLGIAPEHHQHIFRLFKRLNGNRNSGTGIGLALCAKIVENFGGKMWVDSDLGRGSTFYFTVPTEKHR